LPPYCERSHLITTGIFGDELKPHKTKKEEEEEEKTVWLI